jgi:Holliday junction resolvase RusA-like endonuclease
VTETQPLLTGDDRIVLPKITVPGVPIPKGSIECLGARGKVRHLLVDEKRKLLEPWQNKIAATARQLIPRFGQITGPVAVSCTFTVPRPPSVSPVKRPWPHVMGSGDLDKLVRAVFDGLTRSTLIKDDAQVVGGRPWKCYPHTPDCPDRLDEPGVVIRIEVLP